MTAQEHDDADARAEDCRPVLDIENLRVTYEGPAGPVHAVRGVSFVVEPGETFGLVGGSGSGKSTILDALLGLTPPGTAVEASTLTLDGTDLRSLDPEGWRSIRRSRIALIPQHPMTALAPTTSVRRQVEWYLGAGALERHRDEFVRIGLDAVLDRPDDLPRAFSGGQLQRLVIAIATFGSAPELILADEPTSTLDATVQAAVLDALAERRSALGSAMVFVSHDLAVVASVCDRVGVLSNGELVETGSVQRLFSKPEHPFTKALVSASSTSGRTVSTGPASGGTGDADGHPLLLVDGVTHSFGGAIVRRDRKDPGHPVGDAERNGSALALDDVGLRLAEGRTLAIVGESGSGKTTLARVIAGSLVPTAGSVRVAGKPLTPKRSPEDRRSVQLVVQNSRAALNPRRSVGHALLQAQRVHGLGDDRSERQARAIEVTEKVGLRPEHLRRRPGRLSGGELARAVIARSLLLSPRLLILDEPTASLDAQVKTQVLDLIARLRDDLGLTVVVITHELRAARALADEVAVMDAGRIVEHGPTEQVLTDPDTDQAKALLASELHLS